MQGSKLHSLHDAEVPSFFCQHLPFYFSDYFLQPTSRITKTWKRVLFVLCHQDPTRFSGPNWINPQTALLCTFHIFRRAVKLVDTALLPEYYSIRVRK